MESNVYKVKAEAELEKTKEKMELLDEIDRKLHQMKQIAYFSQSNTLTTTEVSMYNKTLNRLYEEIKKLEKIYIEIHIETNIYQKNE